MLAGEVDHKDTLGNAGTIGPGDVQWMTAGGGIMHEEMPRPRDGKMGGFQLWVNMPAVLKMSQPRYQEVPDAEHPGGGRDDGSRVRVVAGAIDGVRARSPRSTPTPSTSTSSCPPAPFVQPSRAARGLRLRLSRRGEFGVGCDLGYRGDLDGRWCSAPGS
jgi:redox-sensitive bicupin YhaK (pirin superfamily)